MTAELKRMRSQDALMFLAWLEKTVFYPMSRKRGDSPALQEMPVQPRAYSDSDADADEDLHIPKRKLPPVPKPKRVRPAPPPLGEKILLRSGLVKLRTMWRGEAGLTYLGPAVTVGFHRSWSYVAGFGSGWSRLDHEIADYYRSRNTENTFVQHALDTPGNEMWHPTHGEMFTAGFATKRWDERKAGY